MSTSSRVRQSSRRTTLTDLSGNRNPRVKARFVHGRAFHGAMECVQIGPPHKLTTVVIRARNSDDRSGSVRKMAAQDSGICYPRSSRSPLSYRLAGAPR